jgi:integrase
MTARNQIYPILGEKVITDITSADIRGIFNKMMTDGYAYTSVKKVHDLFNEYFRYLTQQELIAKNPMTSAGMIKKANYLSMQGKENLPQCDTITVFTKEEIEKFKEEAFSTFSNGKRKYQQASAYILMLNTGLRTGEVLGLLNSDIDLEHRVMHLNRGVKEVSNRDGVTAQTGRQVKVGKLKTATSKRDVPLNDTAIAMIRELREEMYFGENSPLIPDENGNFTRPVNFRKRFYRILKASGIETKGLHSLRHTFATNLVNGIKQADGTLKSLTTRQVADLLGHTTSEITETYYVKRDMKKLNGITDGFDF